MHEGELIGQREQVRGYEKRKKGRKSAKSEIVAGNTKYEKPSGTPDESAKYKKVIVLSGVPFPGKANVFRTFAGNFVFRTINTTNVV